jgi:molybdopterin-guanine dinucleotide biosynthesis protein A
VENGVMLSWVILAGGQALRMGGQDKGLLSLHSYPLIEYVLTPLRTRSEPVYINANRNLERYSDYAPVIRDAMSGFQGPLAGIHASLKQIESDWVGFVPCDGPNLSVVYLDKMYQALDTDSDILVAHDGQQPQPAFSIWNKRVLPRLESYLTNGDRKMKLFLQQCNTKYIDFSGSPELFINLNTPAQLQHDITGE